MGTSARLRNTEYISRVRYLVPISRAHEHGLQVDKKLDLFLQESTTTGSLLLLFLLVLVFIEYTVYMSTIIIHVLSITMIGIYLCCYPYIGSFYFLNSKFCVGTNMKCDPPPTNLRSFALQSKSSMWVAANSDWVAANSDFAVPHIRLASLVADGRATRRTFTLEHNMQPRVPVFTIPACYRRLALGVYVYIYI